MLPVRLGREATRHDYCTCQYIESRFSCVLEYAVVARKYDDIMSSIPLGMPLLATGNTSSASVSPFVHLLRKINSWSLHVYNFELRFSKIWQR